MLLDELPRLTNEERDALDGGYTAIEGVPAIEPSAPRFPLFAYLFAVALMALALAGIVGGAFITGDVIAHQNPLCQLPR